MSLKQIVAKAQESLKGNGSTGKNATWYNKQNKCFIVDLLNNDDPTVRAAAVSCEFVPAKMLQNAFSEETDTDVIRAILMQPKLSVTSLIAFASDAKCTQFENDEELCTHIKERIVKES